MKESLLKRIAKAVLNEVGQDFKRNLKKRKKKFKELADTYLTNEHIFVQAGELTDACIIGRESPVLSRHGVSLEQAKKWVNRYYDARHRNSATLREFIETGMKNGTIRTF